MLRIFRNTILLSLGLLLLNNCQEVFEHTIDSDQRFLVVNGLLTTGQGPHGVNLSMTTPYGQTLPDSIITGATVSIKDGDGYEIFLEETSPGWYYTSNDFKGVVGQTYTLHISTTDGLIYQSNPQTIKQPIEFDDMNAVFGNQVFFFRSQVSNRMYEDLVEGIKVFVENHAGESNPMFRIKSDLYLQHVRVLPGPDGTEAYDYCWMIRDITELLPSDIPDYSTAAGYYQHQVGFLPYNNSDLRYFFPAYNYDQHRTLITTIYSLNEGSFNFHKAKNDQLTDEGKFFDPIAAEPLSNMHCINDPGMRVFGLFEASAELSFSIRAVYNSSTGQVALHSWNQHHDVPATGCLYMEYPDFWIH
ncbi:MAG: DUF4249 domain-containing protein [Bacteroidales bacterium]|nr:DUF4249 domain-containing protein [Bacteroidales bacterium]